MPETTCTSVAAYLEADRKAEYPSEYFHGEVFARDPSTVAHAALTVRIGSELIDTLRERGCHVLMCIRLQVSPDVYYYPDTILICGDIVVVGDERDMVTNPILVVEILSKSTEAYDRGEKFAQYRRIPTLQHYVLASQYKPIMEAYARQPDGTWTYSAAEGIGTTLNLQSLDVTLPWARVYHNVPGIPA